MDWLVYFVGMDGLALNAKVEANTPDEAIEEAAEKLGILTITMYVVNVWPWSEVAV